MKLWCLKFFERHRTLVLMLVWLGFSLAAAFCQFHYGNTRPSSLVLVVEVFLFLGWFFSWTGAFFSLMERIGLNRPLICYATIFVVALTGFILIEIPLQKTAKHVEPKCFDCDSTLEFTELWQHLLTIPSLAFMSIACISFMCLLFNIGVRIDKKLEAKTADNNNEPDTKVVTTD